MHARVAARLVAGLIAALGLVACSAPPSPAGSAVPPQRDTLAASMHDAATTMLKAVSNGASPVAPSWRYGTLASVRGVAAVADGTTIRLSYYGGAADGDCAVSYEPHALESERGVVVYLVPDWYEKSIACDSAAYPRTADIELKAPLGSREVIDLISGEPVGPPRPPVWNPDGTLAAPDPA